MIVFRRQSFIAPTAFRELIDNIRNGLLPETISIELSEKAPLEYAWEPDGSGMIWHNKGKENKRVPIESITFQYAVVKAQYDEEQTGRLLPMPSHALTGRINEQIAPIQTTLADMSKQSRWTMMGVVALVVMVIWFLKTSALLKDFHASLGRRRVTCAPSNRGLHPHWSGPAVETKRTH
jgi:hypothetical protein